MIRRADRRRERAERVQAYRSCSGRRKTLLYLSGSIPGQLDRFSDVHVPLRRIANTIAVGLLSVSVHRQRGRKNGARICNAKEREARQEVSSVRTRYEREGMTSEGVSNGGGYRGTKVLGRQRRKCWVDALAPCECVSCVAGLEEVRVGGRVDGEDETTLQRTVSSKKCSEREDDER